MAEKRQMQFDTLPAAPDLSAWIQRTELTISKSASPAMCRATILEKQQMMRQLHLSVSWGTNVVMLRLGEFTISDLIIVYSELP